MKPGSRTRPTVLIVEDEAELADMFATWLGDRCEVRTAYRGEEGLEKYDSDVDVVLLDRLMPDLSGDEVLEAIRDQGLDCQVVMVTAVNPDFDILDMGFDGYVTKPVDREELIEIVEQMLTRREYSEQTQTYISLVLKKATLEAEKSQAEIEESPEFDRLTRRIADLRDEMDSTTATFDNADFEAAFRDLDDG